MSSYHHSAEYCHEIVDPYYDPIRPSPELITVNLTKENIKSLWLDDQVAKMAALAPLCALMYRTPNAFLGVYGQQVSSLQHVIGLIPIAVIFFVIHCSYNLKSLKTMFFTPQVASDTHNTDEDLSNYILILEDNTGIGEKTLNGISNSMKRLIQKEQPKNLLKLLEISSKFEGVEKFDSDQVQPLLNVGLHNSWSLPLNTLPCDRHTSKYIRNMVQ
ncbi:hypothetical protein Tco_1456206 [Tanacetum coccineum]